MLSLFILKSLPTQNSRTRVLKILPYEIYSEFPKLYEDRWPLPLWGCCMKANDRLPLSFKFLLKFTRDRCWNVQVLLLLLEPAELLISWSPVLAPHLPPRNSFYWWLRNSFPPFYNRTRCHTLYFAWQLQTLFHDSFLLCFKTIFLKVRSGVARSQTSWRI